MQKAKSEAIAKVRVGAVGTRSVTVTRDLTVAHYRSDMPEVYGTPMMIFLMEEAAAAAIHDDLPEGWVSVGLAVDIRHLAATVTGTRVTATATVLSVDDNRVHFSVEAHNEVEKIGDGTHVRGPVHLASFEERTRTKAR